MTDAEMAELEKLCAEASQGPWWAVESGGDFRVEDKAGAAIAAWTHAYPEGAIPIDPCDAQFIAAARQAVPALIAEVRKLRDFLRAPLTDNDSVCIVCGQDFGHRQDCRWVAMVKPWGQNTVVPLNASPSNSEFPPCARCGAPYGTRCAHRDDF